ncbi:FAD:protein FMN transferase [Nocardia africana]|uniref:FAD:protein FMN transferase n=1 Tax=Nocardia africana TaxID=134964 RepID=A0A378WMS3_9NOCA|nr:FAD:protein FMN transferase [Nocardia africana]MCC3315177.1 FAD:protein FMN transferase [Nocardia africana]SUA42529.1 Thiamine biosynthesis lipoprotein ApbE precursor [Nocardia africana]
MSTSRGAAAASETFPAIGTSVAVVCTDARELARAAGLVRARLDELDRAASRFRADSELAVINARSAEARRDRSEHVRIPVGVTLGSCLRAAMRTQRLTSGLVSASLGAALIACGYDDDLDVVRARGDVGAAVLDRGSIPLRHMFFDEQQREVTLSAGTALDLGASAKAWAADTIAAELGATGPGGYLVNLGGDIAVAGAVPPQGWSIGVRDWNDVVVQVVTSTGQAFATSSTRLRTWTRGGIRRHHIIDPRTGRSARTRWAQVTCAGPDAVQANAASTAAIILDDQAPRWLTDRGVPACLMTVDHEVVTTPGWPVPAAARKRHVS